MDGSDSRGELLEAGWHDQSVGVAHVGGMIRRQLGPAFLAFLGTVLAGSAFVVLSEPLYTASSSIYAEVEGAAAAEASSLMQLDTHVELVRSDRTTSAVIRQLRLDETFQAEPSVLRRIVVGARRWLNLQGDEGPLSEQAEILRAVESGLTVERVGNTAIIDISYTSPSKDLSVAIANAYAATYLDEVARRAAESTERRLQRLQERATEVRRRATAATDSVQRLRLQNEFVVTGSDDLEGQIADLRQRLSLLDVDEAAARAKLALIPVEGDLETVQTAALQTPESVEIHNGFLTARSKLAQLRANSGVSAATIEQLEASIAEMRGSLERELRRSRDALELELTVIAAHRSSVVGELKRITDYGGSAAWSELLHVEREAEVYESLYQDYLSDLESAYRQSQTSDVRLISEALHPLNPSYPNYKVVLALVTIFGLVLGGGLALYREWARRAGQAGLR